MRPKRFSPKTKGRWTESSHGKTVQYPHSFKPVQAKETYSITLMLWHNEITTFLTLCIVFCQTETTSRAPLSFHGKAQKPFEQFTAQWVTSGENMGSEWGIQSSEMFLVHILIFGQAKFLKCSINTSLFLPLYLFRFARWVDAHFGYLKDANAATAMREIL